jgi:hypothetical protein
VAALRGVVAQERRLRVEVVHDDVEVAVVVEVAHRRPSARELDLERGAGGLAHVLEAAR